MDARTQLVNEAVGICVRRFVETTTDIVNLAAYSTSVGRRIQGTYGAELRRTAEENPAMTALELFAAVIAPAEFPYDTEARATLAQFNAGARDRARRRGWIADMDEPPPVASDISERVAALRELVGDEPPKFTPPERVVVDRDDLRVVPPEIYAAAEEGRRQFQENRRARLDAAK